MLERYTPVWEDENGSIGRGIPRQTIEECEALFAHRVKCALRDRWYKIEKTVTVTTSFEAETRPIGIREEDNND